MDCSSVRTAVAAVFFSSSFIFLVMALVVHFCQCLPFIGCRFDLNSLFFMLHQGGCERCIDNLRKCCVDSIECFSCSFFSPSCFNSCVFIVCWLRIVVGSLWNSVLKSTVLIMTSLAISNSVLFLLQWQ